MDGTGTLLATGGTEGLVKVWDIKGGYVTHTFRGHGGIISALYFFELSATQPHGNALTNGDAAASRKAAKKKGKQARGAGEVADKAVRTFCLASGDENGKVRIWDLQKRGCVSVLDSHVSIVRDLGYSPEKGALVSASRDKTIVVWDAATWSTRRVVPVLESVESAGFLAGGRYIYTGGEQGKVRLFSTDTGQERTPEQRGGSEGDRILQIVHRPSLDFLLSVHSDQSLLLHSVKPLSEPLLDEEFLPLPVVRRISGTHDEIIDLAYLTPKHSLLALATNSEDARIISVAREASTVSVETDGSDGSFYFGSDVALLKGHHDIIICLDVDASGHWLATGAKDNTARLWRIDPDHASFTCVAVFSGHAESLGAIALPKSKPSKQHHNPLDHPPEFLLTGSQDLTVKCWHVPALQSSGTSLKKAPQARYTRKAHDKDINSIDINHDMKLFASASQDRTVKIWSLDKGEVQGILRGHRRGVWSVRFAPKGAPSITGHGGGSASGSRGAVLTGSADKTIKIWSLADYSCLRTLEGHTNSVLKVVWLPLQSSSPSDGGDEDEDAADGHDGPRTLRLASAGGDGLVKVWDAISGEAACTLDNHTDRVWALTVKPATTTSASATTSTSTSTSSNRSVTLVSGGGDGVISFWRDTTAATAAAAETAAAQRVEQAQQLENLVRARAYGDAIALALRLEHPARLLALFTAAVHTAPPEPGALSGVRAVDAALARLDAPQLWALLLRIRDWNTNARTAPVAQRLLWVLAKTHPVAAFVGLRAAPRRRHQHHHRDDGDAAAAGGGDGHAAADEAEVDTAGVARGAGGTALLDVLDALKAYTQRHYERIDELVDESYLVEYTLREMDEVGV